jgi:hypothetical protein
MGDAESPRERVQDMRAGVAGVVRRGGDALKRVSAPTLVTALCAGAIAPVVAAGAAAGPLLIAVLAFSAQWARTF